MCVGAARLGSLAENSFHGVGNVVIMQTKTLNLVVAGILTIGVVCVSMACCDVGQSHVGDSGEPHRSMDVDSELAHLTKELDLTDEQRERILPILVEHQRKEEVLHQNTSLSSDDLRAQAHAISDETHKEIDPLLTDRQRELVKAIKERGHHGLPGGAPPASVGG